MEKKLRTERPWIMEIPKFYLTHPVVSSPAPILFSKDHNAQSSQHPPPSRTDPQRRKNDPLGALIGACLYSVVSYNTAVAPLERIKLLLQTQNEQIRSGRLSYPYRGIKDCLRRTIKHEGFLSLWRGNMTNLSFLFQTRAVQLGILSYFQSNASPKGDEHGPRNYSPRVIGIALVITYIPHLLAYPLDFGRTRLACDVKQAHGSWQFTTLIDTYQKMLKSSGIAGLYRGYSMALCGDLVTLSIAVSRAKAPEKDNRQAAVYVNAAMLRATTHLLCYPLDTVCKRMMMTTGEDAKYAGAIDAFRQIAKREGLLSLYKGVGASLLRECAASFLYSSIIKLMSSAPSKRN